MLDVASATQALISTLTGYATDTGETLSNPQDLEALKQTLLRQAQELDGADLKTTTLSGSEFGGRDLGFSLGDHHGRARRVIVDTILGVVEDLNRYHDGVRQAAEMLDAADVGSADSMERSRQRVEADIVVILDEATEHSEGDQAYDESRNSSANEGRPEGAADEIPPEDAQPDSTAEVP